MDGNDLEMTQVIHGQDDSEDEAEREIRAILKLHDQDAPAAFQSFHLKPGTNVVGRSRTCDVIIENYAVSKQHAIIDVGSDSCTIMDLGSQNKVKIGKRTLKPNCQYNLDYNEEFCIAGLRARILYDQNNGAKSDTGSDTCSESLLTAIEVSKDQEGVDAEACDNADKPEPSAAAAGLDEETGAAVESKLEVSNKTASKSSQNAKTCNSEYQSSGSFTMPEMPMLDYTQTDSSQGTEPYAGADRDAQTNQEGAGAGAPAAQVPVGANAPAAKDTDAFLCAPTQPYSDATCGGNAGDTFKPATADQESRLNAETQPYTDNAERPEVPSSNPGEIIDLEMDETDRLNAPTQAYENDPSAEAEQVMAECQAYIEKTEGQHEEKEAAEAQEETPKNNLELHGQRTGRKEWTTRKRKGPEAVEELPTTRRKATRRGAREEPPTGTELLVEDSLGDVEQPEALESPQQSNIPRRGRLPRGAVGRKTVPRVAVTNIVEDTEQSEGEPDADRLSAQETESIDGTPSDTSESLTPRGKAVPRPRSSKAPRSKDPKEGVASRKRKGPEAAEELLSTRRKTTRRGAQERPPTGTELLAEDSPGDIEQPEALQSPQQSNKPRHGRPPRGTVGRKTAPKVVDTKIVEDTEQSEGEPDADRLSAQETESIEGTPLETSSSLTPSQETAVPHPRYGARGTRQLLQQDAKRVDEAASKDESGTDHLSAQDTESINGTPSETPEKLTASEGNVVPSLSKASRRSAKTAKQSLQQDVEEEDKTALDGPVAGNSEEQLQGVRTSRRGKASAKTRSGQDEEANNVAAVDVSLTSVESSQSPQTSRRGKRRVKHSQEKSEPPVQNRLNDSTQSLSTEPQSQTSRSSQLGRRNTKQPETQENFPSMEPGESQIESEAHSTKPSRSGRKGTKLSQEAASKSVASAGETNPEPGSADHDLQTRRTRRGRNAAVPSQNEQVVPTPEATEDPSENSGTEAEPVSSQTWRGRKGAKPTRNQRDNKNAPKDNNVKETSEAPEPSNSRSSKPSRTTNLSLLKRTAAASSARSFRKNGATESWNIPAQQHENCTSPARGNRASRQQ
ncbi:hypothetical protein HPB49_021445 [Dermacentor silvarum]|uniref:Uncharacterized protein n=1 Tax=Dermacentor silvarum TaxID=543639 RepID=A0ACB8DRE4_DERSI|nr:hypothetical protein HPB49_021445 [Dermacentor silvarum]